MQVAAEWGDPDAVQLPQVPDPFVLWSFDFHLILFVYMSASGQDFVSLTLALSITPAPLKGSMVEWLEVWALEPSYLASSPAYAEERTVILYKWPLWLFLHLEKGNDNSTYLWGSHEG